MRYLAVVLTLLVAVTGCASPPVPLRAPPSGPPTTATVITVPDVVGDNAAVAEDTLRKLGFTNIDLGTVDGRPMGLLPQNWTVKTQSARPGEKLTPDAKIVLGCVRNEPEP